LFYSEIESTQPSHESHEADVTSVDSSDTV